jgi:hypothetical protein
VSSQMGILPGPFELEGGNVRGEASHDASHFPWAKSGTRCPYSTTLDSAIMLTKPSGRIWTRADVHAGVADC